MENPPLPAVLTAPPTAAPALAASVTQKLIPDKKPVPSVAMPPSPRESAGNVPRIPGRSLRGGGNAENCADCGWIWQSGWVEGDEGYADRLRRGGGGGGGGW